MGTETPFEDFRQLVGTLPGPDDAARLDTLRRMAGFSAQGTRLGRIGEIAGWLAAWRGRDPQPRRPLVALFAGTHGISRHDDPAQGAAGLKRLVEHGAAGGAAVNQVCAARDLGLKVFDLALDVPTGDITREPALDQRACAATMAFGMEAVAGGIDLLCLGSIGAGDAETVAAAIMAALSGEEPAPWCRTSDAVNDPERAARQTALVARALDSHAAALDDPLEILRRLGGREFAAIAGAILAARVEKVPVILDGYVATAAAAVLHALDASSIEHCLLGHVTAAPAHRRAAERLGLAPLIELSLGEGEGLGAALAAGLVRDAAQICAGMKPIS